MTGFASEILKTNKNRKDEIAIVDRAGTREVTWGTIFDCVFRVVAYADKQGLEGIVPVCMGRGLEATATILGLNLAGLGVAPLSLTTPQDRRDSVCAQVGNDIWNDHTYAKALRQLPADNLCPEGKEAEPAYVVFTSGSTGSPKGVMLSNEAIIAGMRRTAGSSFFDFQPGDRLLQCVSLSFVMQVSELLAPLYACCRVYVLPEKSRGNIAVITDYINRFSITKLFMPPQLYKSFDGAPSLKCVCVGSDTMAELGPKGCRLVNVYGMSETAACAFSYDVKEPMSRTPIGMPGSDIKTYILDENGNPSDKGELCMSGNLASGYLGLPELSAKTFTENPFSSEPEHELLLHSGDFVERLSDGNYLYLKRMDNMIKINGQRVEPYEIEAVMRDYKDIDMAVVKGFVMKDCRSILCAWYTCIKKVDEEALRKCLGEKLPRYMVPSIFVELSEMPLNANGKLDRRTLELPDIYAMKEAYERPRGKIEVLICKAFEAVLSKEEVGRNDDFFLLGGDSLSAVQMPLQEGLDGLTVVDVLSGRTPKKIAELYEGHEKDDIDDLNAAALKKEFPLTADQEYTVQWQLKHPLSVTRSVTRLMKLDKTEVDMVRMAEAVSAAVKNHPAFFTEIYKADDGSLCQRFNGDILEKIHLERLTDIDFAELSESLVKPFPMINCPLIRIRVFETETVGYVFTDVHHIIYDGASEQIFLSDIRDAYCGKKLRTDYYPYILDTQCQRNESPAFEEDRLYFEGKYGNTDWCTHPKIIEKNKVGDVDIKSELIPITLSQLEDFTKRKGISQNVFFAIATAKALAASEKESDLMLFWTFNGRTDARELQSVGCLRCNLPISFSFDNDDSFESLCLNSIRQVNEGIVHYRYPYFVLHSDFLDKGVTRVLYQGTLGEAPEIPGLLEFTNFTKANTDSRIYVNYEIYERDEKLMLNLRYTRDNFEQAATDAFAERFMKTLVELISQE